MTRIKLSIAILILIFGVGFGSQIWINYQSSNITEIASRTEELFISGNKSQAIESAHLLGSEWEDFRRYAGIFVRRNKLTEIDRLCARMESLAENDSEEILTELAELKKLIERDM